MPWDLDDLEDDPEYAPDVEHLECFEVPVQGTPFNIIEGASVKVLSAFKSADQDQYSLEPGLRGKVSEIDEDGDAFINFEGLPTIVAVYQADFGNLVIDERPIDLRFNVFVYGSLLSKLGNHHHLREAKPLLTDAQTKAADYRLYSAGSFPFVFRAAPGKGYRIRGEVYEIDESTLERLDRLENHPNWYVRHVVDVVGRDEATSGRREPISAWMYIMEHEGTCADQESLEEVGNGDWREWETGENKQYN